MWPMFETYSDPLVDRMILTVLYTVASRCIVMVFMSFSETPDDVEVLNVFEVTRPSESRLDKQWNNLFHASRPENYLGILSR